MPWPGSPGEEQPARHTAYRLPDPPAAGVPGLSPAQEAQVPVGRARAGGTAGRLVVVVDTESRLDHHVAVVVFVLAGFLCSRREQNRLTQAAAQTQGERKGAGHAVRPGPAVYYLQELGVWGKSLLTFFSFKHDRIRYRE